MRVVVTGGSEVDTKMYTYIYLLHCVIDRMYDSGEIVLFQIYVHILRARGTAVVILQPGQRRLPASDSSPSDMKTHVEESRAVSGQQPTSS